MLKNIFLVILLNLLTVSITQAEDKIAIIDINFIINNSNSGKFALKEFNTIKEDAIKKLKERETIIEEKNIQLNSQKNILSKEEFKKKVLDLKKEINKFNTDREKIIGQLDIKRKNDLDILVKKITPYIEEYMKKNSIGMILNQNNLFIAKKKYNITNDILKLVNNNIK